MFLLYRIMDFMCSIMVLLMWTVCYLKDLIYLTNISQGLTVNQQICYCQRHRCEQEVRILQEVRVPAGGCLLGLEGPVRRLSRAAPSLPLLLL